MMATAKLTLSMEPDVVYKAKQAAKKQNISLSKLVENYLKSVSNQHTTDKDEHEISDFVKKMIAIDRPVADFDHKAAYHAHLEERYRA